ncbi:MAG: 2-isopropylmalate synthase [Lentisphaerae bacterium ADurb.BinA184]|nr:MAG: 2-isopropylmalate synthase [Lentisphaerae bacterium ADurb.BinA184]
MTDHPSHRLVETGGPNLLEGIFPYTEVPRIPFDGPILEVINGQVVRFDPDEAVRRDLHITDTTFRDGQQARPPYSVEQMVTVYDLLARLGGPNGVIRQTEFFLYTRNDRETIERCRALGHRYPEITGWIRADPGDFKLVRDMGLRETGMLTSCSDYHIFHKLRKDRRKAFDDYLAVVQEAIQNGVRPRCHLEDVTRADIDGFVVPFVARLMELSEPLPEELKVKVRLCDTMGYGISYPGAALPRSIPKLIHRMVHEAGVPPERLEWHGHNDFHKVHINAATCWLYGANALNASLFGFGERTGNPPLEGALIEYAGIKGHSNGADLAVITEIAEYFTRTVGATIPANYPFVGLDFNTTRAGIHADGLRRDERIYSIFDTARILRRPPQVAITDKSGADGVALWVNQHLGLTGDAQLSKIKVHKIARWVMDQYNLHGRTTAISADELAEQVRLHLPEYAAGRR